MQSITLNEVFREHRLEPVVLAIVGPNGSGKSSAARALGIADPGDSFGSNHIRIDEANGTVHLRFVNADDFSAQIRETHPDMNQETADRIAARLAEKKRVELARERSDFGFETVGSHISKPQFLRDLKRFGYFVAVLFVGTENPGINERRVAMRVHAGGHDVALEKMSSRYFRTMEFLHAYFEVADYIAIYDNSVDAPDGGPRLLAAKGPDGELKTTGHCDDVRWIRTYLLDLM